MRQPDDATKPLWPALIEKAYAQMIGGYDVAVEGVSATVMEALTGVASEIHHLPGIDAELLAMLRGMQGKAMTAASLTSKHDVFGGFQEVGPNRYTAALRTPGGVAPRIIPKTLKVFAPRSNMQAVSHAVGWELSTLSGGRLGDDWGDPTAQDDGDGKLVGNGVSGSVQYSSGHITVSSTGEERHTADRLVAACDWNGLLDKDLLVYADHSYIFERVTPEGLIELRNPWGFAHPHPMTPAAFRRLFTQIQSDAVAAPRGTS
jgi:hypothetical protein